VYMCNVYLMCVHLPMHSFVCVFVCVCVCVCVCVILHLLICFLHGMVLVNSKKEDLFILTKKLCQ
jgi:hypothetical protein